MKLVENKTTELNLSHLQVGDRFTSKLGYEYVVMDIKEFDVYCYSVSTHSAISFTMKEPNIVNTVIRDGVQLDSPPIGTKKVKGLSNLNVGDIFNSVNDRFHIYLGRKGDRHYAFNLHSREVEEWCGTFTYNVVVNRDDVKVEFDDDDIYSNIFKKKL